MEAILAETKPADNPLLTPVHIRENVKAALKSDHPAANILTQPGLVVQRHHEILGMFSKLEESTKFVILDPRGNHLGYMAEHDGTFQKISPGQMFRTHRTFTTHVFDRHLREVLRVHRPSSSMSTQVRVYDALERNSIFQRANNVSQSELSVEAMPIIGEARSQGISANRKYDLFLPEPGSISTIKPKAQSSDLQYQQARQIGMMPAFAQFAHIDKPFSSLDFPVTAENGQLIGFVNRSFRGISQEIFDFAGAYVLRLDCAGHEQQMWIENPSSQPGTVDAMDSNIPGKNGNSFELMLDQRAVMLGAAVALNFDYFSRPITDDGIAFIPIPIPIPGGAAPIGAGAGAGTGAAGVGEVGAVVGGAGRAVGGAAAGEGFGGGAIAGAGALAGYDAMQRGMGQNSSQTTQDASPQAPQADSQSPQSTWETQDQQGDVWGQENSDPWSDAGAPSGSGDGDGGGWFQWFWDLFS